MDSVSLWSPGEIPKGPAMHSSPVPLAFQETEWQEEAEAKPPWVLETAGRMGLCPFFTAPSLLRRIWALFHTYWRVWKKSLQTTMPKKALQSLHFECFSGGI